MLSESGHDEYGIHPLGNLIPHHKSHTTFQASNIIPHHGPKNPSFASKQSRLESFNNSIHPWPPGLKQKPCELAEAGFYYLGTGDQVLCFYCDGGMHKWDPTDEPWTEHAKWFPQCGYLLTKKNPAFVDHIQRQLNTEASFDSGLSESGSDIRSESPNDLEFGKLNLESTILPEVVKHKDTSSHNPSIEDLLAENKRLKEEKLCKVCWEKDKEIVFIPCGHFSTCSECGLRFEKCPVCRAKIKSIVKSYSN